MGYWETNDTIRKWHVEKALSVNREANDLIFDLDKGIMKMSVISSNCIKVTFNTSKDFLDIPSFAVINETKSDNFELDQDNDSFRIKTKELIIKVYRNNARIVIYDFQGNIISQDMEYGFSFTKENIKCNKFMSKESHFYGLGEKTGFLDKRGRKYTMWNTDEPLHTPLKDPLYKSIPFLINFDGNCATGIFIDNTSKISFDLGKENSQYYAFEVNDTQMDYYFIYGPDMKRVIKTYTDLTGKMYLPPKWALGYQQCRWSYFPDNIVRKLADTFREKDIPCDVIYLDIDYMDGYRVFTWDKNRFPEPEKMMEDLRKKGFKIVTIVDPGVKKDAEYEVFQEGVMKDLFCKRITGEVYIGKVWPGEAAYPDFTKDETRKWWGKKHRELIGKGVSGIWNDMNEPSDFSIATNKKIEMTVPNDVVMANDGHPATFRKYHNAYGLNMCKATYGGFKMIKPNERPFIVTRSAYAGIQRYSAVWTGDNCSWWEHLYMSMPMFMNIGMSGIPFVGGDVGGFQDDATPELFARWMQLGAFTPFFRAHSALNTKANEPWAFGEKVETVCRKYIKLRYKLLPYTYNEFYKSSITGLPILKPLVLEYSDDENVHNLSDQFFFGDSMMIAPVYKPSTNKRCVYLPNGTWYNYWTDERHNGKSYIIADAPLDILPIYIKEGSIIPSIEPMNYVDEKKADSLTLDIYVGSDNKYELYEDDGISNDYKEGIFRKTSFELNMIEEGIVFKIKPFIKNYNTCRSSYILKFHCMKNKFPKIDYNGKYEYKDKDGVLIVTLQDTNDEQELVIKY